MSRKYIKLCTNLNYIGHFLILASIIIGYISISAFASFSGIHIGITSSAVGLKTCVIAAAIKKYKSISKKKKHGKIVFPAKSKLNEIEVLLSKGLIDLNISHDKFVLINNVLKEYDEMQ